MACLMAQGAASHSGAQSRAAPGGATRSPPQSVDEPPPREQVSSVTRARLEAAEGALLQLHGRRFTRSEALPPGSTASSGGMRLAFPCARGGLRMTGV